MAPDWRAGLLAHRKEKDAYFRDDPGSPLGPHAQHGFDGLAYFAPDERYRLEVPLVREPAQVLDVPRTGGDVVRYTRVGVFVLDLPEGQARLPAYETDGAAHGDLFLMFRDATSGKETYGGGRYLEATPLGHGRYLVDLNLAYHPFCVYDEGYTCPLPPREAWLQVAVRAGERLPPA